MFLWWWWELTSGFALNFFSNLSVSWKCWSLNVFAWRGRQPPPLPQFYSFCTQSHWLNFYKAWTSISTHFPALTNHQWSKTQWAFCFRGTIFCCSPDFVNNHLQGADCRLFLACKEKRGPDKIATISLHDILWFVLEPVLTCSLLCVGRYICTESV